MFKMPEEIKNINFYSNILYGVFFVFLILIGFQFFLKNKLNNFSIIIKGDISHNDVKSVRNHIISNMSGNFYNMNLNESKKIFESLTWVNHAVIKRVYPNQIVVKLSEFKPKAVWGAHEDLKLVDENGVLFDVNTEEDVDDQMPQLIGPEGKAKLLLDMYKDLVITLSPLKNKLKILELNVRGSWIVTLETGAHIELGRGNPIDIISRVNKFTSGAEQMLVKLNKKILDIQYIDLRHSDGYAMRMQGVGTLDPVILNASIKK
jgi:cell division protein FtsQ